MTSPVHPLVVTVSDLFCMDHIAAIFDKKLNYVFINPATCRHLKKKPEELIGRSIIDIYPQIISSDNHRHLLRALSGIEVSDAVIEGRVGTGSFRTSYLPVLVDGNVEGVLVTSKKVIGL